MSALAVLRARTAAQLAVVLAASVVLAGCATTEAPPLPTEQEIRTDFQLLLDNSWERLELPPSTPRPGFETPALVDSARWWTEYQSCVTTILPKRIYTEVATDWYGVSTDSPDALTSADRVVFYQCLTRFVDADFGMIRLMTVEHLEFLWRYYERWVIPCLADAGYEVGLDVATPPYFETFVANHAEGTLWSPYDGIVFDFVATEENFELFDANYERIVERCGGRYDALDRESGIFG